MQKGTNSNLDNDPLIQGSTNENDGYWANFRKNFYNKAENLTPLENFLNNLFKNRVFASIFWGIAAGIIAVLIGGFTYGLGTVTLASSISLGLRGSSAICNIENSLLNNFKRSETTTTNKEKALKRRFIASLVIGCVFAAATVAIGALTFGTGIISLGMFAAATLTTAFSYAALFNLDKAFRFGTECVAPDEPSEHSAIDTKTAPEDRPEEEPEQLRDQNGEEKI